MSSAGVPKAVVVFGTVNPPQEDIINLRVHLGATREVSSFECTLENWNEKYSPGGTSPISVGDTGGIGISRGSVDPEDAPVISLRVEKVDFQSGPYGENWLVVSGRCWGERLFRRVVTKVYESVKAEDVVKDLLDNYVGLSHVRDSTELVEDTDTTYTLLEYENTPVWDILEYVAGSAVKDGVVGYDFRVAPDGKFEFFPKNSKSSSVSLSGKIEQSEYRKDIHRIRNKIVVYGLADKSTPLDKDAWTESLTPEDGAWTAAAGEVSFDTSVKNVGTGSIKTYGQNDYWVGSVFTLNDGKEVNTNLYTLLKLDVLLQAAFTGTVFLNLYDSEDRVASHTLTVTKENWQNITMRVGKINALEWTTVEPGFDWKDIKKVRVACDFPGTGTGSFWVDGLYFGGLRYSAEREDVPSQNAYGMRELVEVDEELFDDNACDLRAQALLSHFKDPAEYITLTSDTIDYGTTPILAGDKIHVVLPNENVDSDFRVDSIEYYVDGDAQSLELTLELGKVPPRLTDYMYGLRATTVTVEKLMRTKLGKGPLFPLAGAYEDYYHPSLYFGVDEKEKYTLVTDYLKEYCILPVGVAVASPTGNMCSYEGGWIARALIFKNGTGERALAKDILDEFAEIQNADGSWYQQYNPYLNAEGKHDRVEWISPTISGDLKVDSGAALLAWAMSEYDDVMGSEIYKEYVRKALQFIRDLQYAHTVAHGTSLIANMVYEGTTDTVALAADCAECLLAMVAAMDAYGDSLTTSGDYSVKTMANDLYYSLCLSSWQGDTARYYATSYPVGEQTEIPFTYKEKISFTQALCSWANYRFANSGYRTTTDYSYQSESCLDFINTLTAGQWGGQMYAPYYGASDEIQDEFAGYAALMCKALNVVNSTKYAEMISKTIDFIRWLALSDGRVYDCVDKDGLLWRGKISPFSKSFTEAYGFLSLPVALGLLAGA